MPFATTSKSIAIRARAWSGPSKRGASGAAGSNDSYVGSVASTSNERMSSRFRYATTASATSSASSTHVVRVTRCPAIAFIDIAPPRSAGAMPPIDIAPPRSAGAMPPTAAPQPYLRGGLLAGYEPERGTSLRVGGGAARLGTTVHSAVRDGKTKSRQEAKQETREALILA